MTERFIVITIKDGEVTVDTTHPILPFWSILIQNLDLPEGPPLRDVMPTTHYGKSYHEIAQQRRSSDG